MRTTFLGGLLFVLFSTLAVALPRGVDAQETISGISADLLRDVMPSADRFEPKSGEPPVIRAYREDRLVGFVFRTGDMPPEPMGYSGPVQAVVGLALDGTITGARVTEYYESYRSSMGDFLRRRGVQEQFTGKTIDDPFQVNGDVDRVTRATISTRALARGIRDSSRRVAEGYADEMEGMEEAGPVVLEELSWFEMRTRGVLKRILIDSREGHLDISLTPLPDDSVAAFFMGEENVERIHAQARRRELEDPAFLFYALEGPRLRFFLRKGWSVAQDGDTLPLGEGQVYSLGLVRGGRVQEEAVLNGVFMLDDRVARSRPFTLLYRLEGHEGYYSAPFEALQAEEDGAVAEVAEAPAVEAPRVDSAERPAAETVAAPEADTVSAVRTGESAVASSSDDTASASTSSAEAELPPVDFTRVQERSELALTLASTDWSRVAGLVAVVVLALFAFFLKNTALRYVSLAATLVFVGFLDGSFLSVSHVTAGIWSGASVYVRDLSLFVMVVVTGVTTLIWGRVFCGFLCPFGALQDFIERVVPSRLRVRVPRRVHRPALKVKYVVLAGVLLPALLGSRTSLYQYVEPFGTVFFLSPSVLLWAIAGAFLLGTVFIPRFYCRYACPLGAGLALVSFVSLRRIGRVEQCQICKVCEQDCPTGAIEGPDIDFVECVRCNRCETNLIEERGVCGHDMEDIRPRLVQIETTRRGDRAGV